MSEMQYINVWENAAFSGAVGGLVVVVLVVVFCLIVLPEEVLVYFIPMSILMGIVLSASFVPFLKSFPYPFPKIDYVVAGLVVVIFGGAVLLGMFLGRGKEEKVLKNLKESENPKAFWEYAKMDLSPEEQEKILREYFKEKNQGQPSSKIKDLEEAIFKK